MKTRSKRKVLTTFDKWLFQPGTYIFEIKNLSK